MLGSEVVKVNDKQYMEFVEEKLNEERQVLLYFREFQH